MRILITGGTGSLGNALVRTYLAETDARLIVYSRDELKQAQMDQRVSDPRVDYFLGDVRDIARLNLACDAGVDAIVHAAALKRVDAVAKDPVELLKTNIQGTQNVLQAALNCRVPKVLFISSDKACYPTNSYGVSKAMAEHLTVAFNAYSYPKGVAASVLRYGNVLGSRGSVVHVWRQQMKRQGPIIVTEPGMTRFLITMPQAVSLISSALDLMEGGEIFVPRLPASSIESMVEAVCGDVPFSVTGFRPGGEKHHETMLTAEEAARSIDLSPRLSVVTPHLYGWTDKPWWRHGVATVDGERRSDTAERLTADAVRELLKTVPENGHEEA